MSILKEMKMATWRVKNVALYLRLASLVQIADMRISTLSQMKRVIMFALSVEKFWKSRI